MIGMDYLKSVLKPTIDIIIAENQNLEIDPLKILGDQVEAQASICIPTELLQTNAMRLSALASVFLTSIISAKDSAPLYVLTVSSQC